MKILEVPVLQDNYSYLIIDENSKEAAAVDPAEPSKVLNAAKHQDVKITSVLTTHHHRDHAGGNKEMASLIPGIKIYGGGEKVEALTNKVQDGDTLQIGKTIKVKVHHTPCHTREHVLYEVHDLSSSSTTFPFPSPLSLFTGDTLFIAGCGRFFEGTAAEMYHALCEVVYSLPDNTEIYCGHEYTVKNLEFALTIEPNNKAVQEKLAWARLRRGSNMPTIPSTVAQEKAFNPFVRCREPSIAIAVGLSGASPIEVLKELRSRKDKF